VRNCPGGITVDEGDVNGLEAFHFGIVRGVDKVDDALISSRENVLDGGGQMLGHIFLHEADVGIPHNLHIVLAGGFNVDTVGGNRGERVEDVDIVIELHPKMIRVVKGVVVDGEVCNCYNQAAEQDKGDFFKNSHGFQFFLSILKLYTLTRSGKKSKQQMV